MLVETQNFASLQILTTMGNIAAELAKLHILKGADISRQVERIARMDVFHPIENEINIFSARW